MTTHAPQMHGDDDDDDDSLYDGRHAVVATPVSAAKETVLDSTHTDVRKLDAILDEEDHHLHLSHQLAAVRVSRSADAQTLDESQEPQLSDHHSSPYGSPPGTRDNRRMRAGHRARVSDLKHPKHIDRVAAVHGGDDEEEEEDDDDWFDSDENKVDVESLDSSTSSLANSAAAAAAVPPVSQSENKQGLTAAAADDDDDDAPIPVVSSLEREVPKRGKPAAGGGLSLLTRASQTFYKALKKSKPERGGRERAARERASGEARGDDADTAHRRLEQLLEAQIATLQGARTGFVELQLVRPMTERTLDAVRHDARALLRDFGAVARRARRAEGEAGRAERDGEREVAAKERLLIDAKMRLAEASGEVERLRLEASRARRLAAEPERRRRRRVGEVRRDAVVCREARAAAEARVAEQRGVLAAETADLAKLEERYRDIEGDWA